MTAVRKLPGRCAIAGALVATLALVSGAGATVRYVSPTGLDTNAGTSAGSPWSMSKANSSLVAGDLCWVLPGTYSVSISPANAGTSYANRITIVGNLANPAAAIVPSIQPKTAYVTVKGVKGTNGIYLAYPARYDSVAQCAGGELGFWGAKHCMVARNTITGSVAFLANGGNPCYSSQTLDPACIANSEYDTLRANRIDLGEIQPGARSFEFKAWTQHCLLDSNYVSGTFHDPGSTDPNNGIALISYNSYLQTFRDNRWQFEAINNHHDFPNTHWYAFCLRDSMNTTTFQRDSILAGVNSPVGTEIVCIMSASGSFPGAIHDVTMLNCVIRSRGDILWQDKFDRWTLDHCVVQSMNGQPMLLITNWISSKVRNCTVWGVGQTLRMEGPSSGLHMLGTGNEVTSNIFYSKAAGALGNNGGVVMWKDNTSNFISNNNVYFTPTFTSTPGDLSLLWGAYAGSRPGTGQPWNTLTGQDGQSKAGSPAFVDSTLTTFDPRLRAGSIAIGAGQGGTDAGAVPFGAGGGDITPPADISGLAISNIADQSLMLGWAAPGDDGNVGLATAYDLRMSTAPITAGNFAAATALSPSPTPLIAGTAQTYVVTGLSGGTNYYFALKARDEMGNWNNISNVPNATTLTDTTPPAAVKDLTPGP